MCYPYNFFCFHNHRTCPYFMTMLWFVWLYGVPAILGLTIHTIADMDGYSQEVKSCPNPDSSNITEPRLPLFFLDFFTGYQPLIFSYERRLYLHPQLQDGRHSVVERFPIRNFVADYPLKYTQVFTICYSYVSFCFHSVRTYPYFMIMLQHT